MLRTYTDSLHKYGNQYRLNKAVTDGNIVKIEAGIYSDSENVQEIAVIAAKFPNAILTGDYAFYYHGLTDVVPEKYTLATREKSYKLQDSRIHQTYVRDDLFEFGAETFIVDGCSVRIYDKERMLIELLRQKHALPYDYYKEILLNYRGIIGQLQLWRIQEYANIFPKSKMIRKALDEEVL